MSGSVVTRRARAVGAAVLLVVVGVAAYALFGRSSPAPRAPTAAPSSSTSGPGQAPPATAVPPSASAPPAVPTSGAYLGAWVNPNHVTAGNRGNTGAPGTNEVQQLPAFDKGLGRHLAILQFYTPFAKPLPTSTLQAIRADGATPMVDWSCGNLSSINAGREDSLIRAYAVALKDYAHPVFLRWYLEMNLPSKENARCGGYGNGPAYVAAWRHVHALFRSVGATNVAFVWCPSVQSDASSYFPGAPYVDWIGVDGYDRTGLGSAAFAHLFGGFYQQWAPLGKPIMVAETAAHAVDQAAYLRGIQTDVPHQFPDIRAVLYFDSEGPAGNWSLTGDGATAFKELAADPYFAGHG